MEVDEVPEGLEGLDKGIGNIFGKKLKKRKKKKESLEMSLLSIQDTDFDTRNGVEEYTSLYDTPSQNAQTFWKLNSDF